MGPSCCKKQWRSCPATPGDAAKACHGGGRVAAAAQGCGHGVQRRDPVKARSTGFCPVKRSINDGKDRSEPVSGWEPLPRPRHCVALAPDGRQVFIGYFIMGRSANSRNRVFDPLPERGGICTRAADPAKLEDPSLIIYNPVLTLGRTHLVIQRRPDRYLV